MVTVIVVTYNRKVLLQQCLQSILTQNSLEPYEIIIVDNASTDGTFDHIKALLNDRVKCISNARARDLALCKELAVQSAAGDVIAFTDDDCTVGQNWLENIRGSIIDYDVVGGIVLPLESVQFPSWWRHSLEWIVGINSDPGRHFLPLGSNIAFRRAAFKALGASKTSLFFGPYGEDNARLKASLNAGFKLGISRKMIVYHHVGAERLNLSYCFARSCQEGQCLALREPLLSVFLLMCLAFLANPFRFLITWDINRLFRMNVNAGYILTYLRRKR